MSHSIIDRVYLLLSDNLKQELETARFESDFMKQSINGPILLSVHVVAAIRFFVCEEVCDIVSISCISHISAFWTALPSL